MQFYPDLPADQDISNFQYSLKIWTHKENNWGIWIIRTTDFDLQVVFFLKKQTSPIYDAKIETP